MTRPEPAPPGRTGPWPSATEKTAAVEGGDGASIAPSGRRTATAQALGPRIMTPSRTAWPPTVKLRLGTRLGAVIRLDEAANF